MCVWGGGGGGAGGGGGVVLHYRKLALNSDAVQNYKYVFGLHRNFYLIREESQ